MSRVRTPRRQGLRRFVAFSLTSVVVCVAAAVLFAAFNLETLNRYYYMARLCSEAEAKRRTGLNYLIRHAYEPVVQDHARWMLRGADDRCFRTIVRGLSVAGVWGPQFGESWVRYLVQRAETVGPDQRAGIAVELGKLLWNRRPGWRDERIGPAMEKLLRDDDADVRLNALSAAACLPEDEQRSKLIRAATADEEPVIAKHAWIFVGLGAAGDKLPNKGQGPEPAQQGGADRDNPSSSQNKQVRLARRFAECRLDPEISCPPAGPEGPGEDGDPTLRRLAELEGMATASADVEVGDDLPTLLRMHAVRVSNASEPEQLMPVFRAEIASLRDLGCVIAMERFSPEQCRALTKELIGSFNDRRRMAGAILGGMVPPDDRLMELLRMREEEATDWVVQQHYRLGLAMQGEAPDGFDPANLLLKEKMPRTTVVLGLLHLGRLDGLDWLLRPFGKPAVDLRMLLERARFGRVLDRYIAGLPAFGVWAEPNRQRFQADVLRDWYLLNRPWLRFDPERRRFTAEPQGGPAADATTDAGHDRPALSGKGQEQR